MNSPMSSHGYPDWTLLDANTIPLVHKAGVAETTETIIEAKPPSRVGKK